MQSADCSIISRNDHACSTLSTVYYGVPALPQSMQHISLSTPAPLRHQYRNKHARQVGAIVTATINGIVDSWTNMYNGLVPPTPTPSWSIPTFFSVEPSISGIFIPWLHCCKIH